MTLEEAAKLEKQAARAQREQGDRVHPGRPGCPPKGGDGSGGRRETWAATTRFWLDPGSSYTIVDGQKRTSLVIDPPDGRVPAYTAAAKKRVAALLSRPTSDVQESERSGPRTGRLLRRSGAPSAGRALSAGIWFHFRAARAAGLFLQQSASNCSDAGHGDDSF